MGRSERRYCIGLGVIETTSNSTSALRVCLERSIHSVQTSDSTVQEASGKFAIGAYAEELLQHKEGGPVLSMTADSKLRAGRRTVNAAPLSTFQLDPPTGSKEGNGELSCPQTLCREDVHRYHTLLYAALHDACFATSDARPSNVGDAWTSTGVRRLRTIFLSLLQSVYVTECVTRIVERDVLAISRQLVIEERDARAQLFVQVMEGTRSPMEAMYITELARVIHALPWNPERSNDGGTEEYSAEELVAPAVIARKFFVVYYPFLIEDALDELCLNLQSFCANSISPNALVDFVRSRILMSNATQLFTEPLLDRCLTQLRQYAHAKHGHVLEAEFLNFVNRVFPGVQDDTLASAFCLAASFTR